VEEVDAELTTLQSLLDRTHVAAGPHLTSIVTPDRRLGARDLVAELSGYCLLSLATVSASGQPLVSPVDAIFWRGHFYFSTGEDAVRRRHLDRDPRVSGSYVPRPEFAVTVHGRVVTVDHHTDEMIAFRRVLVNVFVPYFGEGFASFVDTIPTYYRIDADKMYCYWRPNGAIS
jgi:uncharacterized pyridoxamine 5'-phosphate oxidase family protein